MKLSKSLFTSLTAGVLLMGAASSCSKSELESDLVTDTPTIENSSTESATTKTNDPVQGMVAKHDSIYRLSDELGHRPDPTICDPWGDCPACGLG